MSVPAATAHQTIRLNGETRTIPNPFTLAELVAQLDLQGKRFAIECNGEIVPKSRYGDTRLAEADRLEIVMAVGGG